MEIDAVAMALMYSGFPIAIRPPDHVVANVLNDWPDVPFSEVAANGYYLRGCYLFFDAGFNCRSTSLYAGKAVKLKNRIGHHVYGHSEWLECYWTDVFEMRNRYLSGIVSLMVWLEHDHTSFEQLLIEQLRPLYNKVLVV